MSENDNQQPLATVFCKNGCGFYGSSQSDGMCSVCFKEALKRRSQESTGSGAEGSIPSIILHSADSSSSLPATAAESAAAAPPDASNPSLESAAANAPSSHSATLAAVASDHSIMSFNSSDASATESTDSLQQSSGSGVRRRNRCYICKKKVGLTGFECRCGGVYCSTHRYSDKHDCQFDYQSQGQAEIRKANPVVVKSKVDKL